MHNRGSTALLECVNLAHEIREGSLSWKEGCNQIASRIIEGKVNPNDACTVLAEISESLGTPKELAQFEILAHEQFGHENIGITTEKCTVGILSECHRLLDD